EVGARAEADVAGADEDQCARAFVGLEGLDAFQQPLRRRPVDRVAPMRAVDGEHGGGADPFITHLVGHGGDPKTRTSRAGGGRDAACHRRGGISSPATWWPWSRRAL